MLISDNSRVRNNYFLNKILQFSMSLTSDFEITAIPPSMVTAELQVIAPGTNEVLTTVQVGQSLALRIVFDNMANNSKLSYVAVIFCFKVAFTHIYYKLYRSPFLFYSITNLQIKSVKIL